MEARRRLAVAQGLALPVLAQTPRSLQHTSYIKRKQVTQMRQMVLVCDDSCNSFLLLPLPWHPLAPPSSASRLCLDVSTVQCCVMGTAGAQQCHPLLSTTRMHMGLSGFINWCHAIKTVLLCLFVYCIVCISAHTCPSSPPFLPPFFFF